MNGLRFKIHSFAKELTNEMLKLAGIDKTANDIFYFGVFCDSDIYLESNDLPEDCPTDADWSTQNKLQEQWFSDLQLKIMKDEIDQPDWMTTREEDGYSGYAPDRYLHIIVKDEKYQVFADKIKSLLGSIAADGGYEG